LTDVFLTILNMSLTASYVIVFIIFVRLLLKKAPKVISYVLWSVVVFRLLCPFSFESILSLGPMNTSTISQNIVYQQKSQISSGITPIDTYVNRSLPVSIAETGANPLKIYTQIGVYIWLLGIAAMLSYSIVSVLRLKGRLKSARHTEGNIWETGNLKTPFVLGVFRPRIFIPAGLSAEEKSYIIRHEQTHILRFDYIIKPFAFLVLSIHWFNPLVWIAFALMGTDMELSCDEHVLKEMGGDIKKAYSVSLLSLATEKRIINGSPLAFGEGDVRGRIKNVLNYKKPAFWVVIVAVIAVSCVGIGLMANPKVSSARETQNNEYKNQKQPVKLTNFVVAKNTTTLSNGKRVSVRLVMTHGKYFDEKYAGAGGGIYPENYQGSYEIQIFNSNGKLISKTNFDNEGEPAKFAGKFSLRFCDYNNDKNPDFSIGQWGSSSMNVYQLYTIMRNGKVKKIDNEAFTHASHDFSVKFNKHAGFYTTFYNNATGKMVTKHYVWDKNKNSFQEDTAE
jgi:beta-lactamase regulating signal transducer with metallopeptidase domain